MRHLLLLNHGSLPQDLHGVHVAGVALLHQADLAESPAAYHLEK